MEIEEESDGTSLGIHFLNVILLDIYIYGVFITISPPPISPDLVHNIGMEQSLSVLQLPKWS